MANYIDNKVFTKEIADCLADPTNNEKIQAVYNSLTLIATKILKGMKWKTEGNDDDYIQESVMLAFVKLRAFDGNKQGANGQYCKAFNYFTTVIINHFKQMSKQHKRQEMIIYKIAEHLISKDQEDCRNAQGSSAEIKRIPNPEDTNK